MADNRNDTTARRERLLFLIACGLAGAVATQLWMRFG